MLRADRNEYYGVATVDSRAGCSAARRLSSQSGLMYTPLRAVRPEQIALHNVTFDNRRLVGDERPLAGP